MIFDGREIPEDEFRRLARRAFRELLDEQDAQVRQSKAQEWFSRSADTEQQLFERWLRELGVAPFPFRIKA